MPCLSHLRSLPLPSGGDPNSLTPPFSSPYFKGTTRSRLDQFDSGSHADHNLLGVLFEGRKDGEGGGVKMEVWHPEGGRKATFSEATQASYSPAQKGITLGPSWTHHWFRITVTLPNEWKDKERVQFEFDPSCEAMIYTLEGLPLQGITGGFGIDRRVEFILPKEARKYPNVGYRFYAEVSCNGMFGNSTGDSIQPPDPNRTFRLNSADLVVPRMEAWHLLWDFKILKDIASSFPLESSSLGNRALVVANDIMNSFDKDDLGTIEICRKKAETIFGPGWQKKGASVYSEGNLTGSGQPNVPQTWGIGNCHIDTAWLWPYSSTQQKIARSWSTQCDLIDRYPEHRFVASQAQQFKWLEQLYPSLFQVVKSKIDLGSFQPIGGTWVEMDTNMPSGEALVRQFSYGQRYFKSRFGKYCETFWLPDTFGYSSQLPQLSQSAGMKYFFTQKLSWSQFNKFPHTTFRWIGLDGSEVLTHMTPVDTYTAQATVGDVRNATVRHKNLGADDKGLLAFGNGDGGGGPLAQMLEGLRRIRATGNEDRELPKVVMGTSVDDFFKRIEKDTEEGKRLTTWQGELYLELHRGTYTSHGSIKRGNRKSEVLLRELEFVGTLASIGYGLERGKGSFQFPKDEVDELWEEALLQQFHDVLPGSAIGLVYEDAEKYFAHIREKGNEILENALATYVPSSKSLSSSSPSSGEFDLLAVNTLSVPRREVVKVPKLLGTNVVSELKETLQLAESDGRDGGGYWALVEDEELKGFAVAKEKTLGGLEGASVTVEDDVFVLSNSFLQVRINSKGRVTSLLDKGLQRQLIPGGETAGFVIFEDRPLYWDAWDVDIYHLETLQNVDAQSVKVHDKGPLRASLSAQIKIGESTWIQAIISLDAVPTTYHANALTMLRFDVTVDWHERHKFLKWQIPLNINSETCTYETQFGTISRPTHSNTTWDAAKFEVCGHKFADLSEWGYGVALLNDCKYGYACHGHVLRLSLLRGSTAPDENQDQGLHEFSFAMLPHRGSFAESDVPIAGWMFNNPMFVRKVARNASSAELGNVSTLVNSRPTLSSPFFVRGARNVIIDTVKRGDDDDFVSKSTSTSRGPKTVIVRLYEAYGGHATADLISNVRFKSATICDILERDSHELAFQNDQNTASSLLRLEFRGFQVITVKLYLH